MTDGGKGRIEFLREIVIDGEDAEAVLKYMNKYREEAEKNVLNTIEESTDKTVVNDAIADYRAALKLLNLLERSVAIAKRKEKALAEELKKPN